MEFTEIKIGKSKEMPAKMAIYGIPKIGKTAFATSAPDAFVINIEGGLDYLENEVRSTPHLKTYDEVFSWLKHIYSSTPEEFTCGTLVIDSLDWLETLAQDKLIKIHNATSITDPKVAAFGYYKGVIEAASMAMDLFKWLDAIYKQKGIKSISIAHCQTKEIDLPNKDAFTRYQLKMSKYLSAKLMEWADLILFADYDFYVSEDGKTSDPKRVLRTGGDASFEGGGRMHLPKVLPLNYKELELELTKTKTKTTTTKGE